LKRNFKKLSLIIFLSFALFSCANDDNSTTDDIAIEFPEEIISYDFPLGPANLMGQTPISVNTTATERINTTDPVIHYSSIILNSVQNTSENLKINLSDAEKTNNYITIKGYKYELQQFHFHRHSEHNVNGEYAAMEIHFVHKSETGAYAVLGVMVKNGQVNGSLQTLIDASPSSAGTNSLTTSIDLNSVLPADVSRYYTYSGSLTTPNVDNTPNEGPVTWVLFKNNITFTASQLNNYAEKYEEQNFRVIQPLNSRTVYENKK